MDILYNAAVLWFIAGFIFFLLEFVIPGLILFFFAVGAWVVAIVCLFIDPSINTQLILFLATSLSTILLFRNWVKKLIWNKQLPSEIEDEFIGKTARSETYIAPGQNGKIVFRGTMWDAKSEDYITKGEEVRIIGNESIVLIVKSTKL
jgi:membrane protein implicated in regulation of membrane protease activity